MKSDPTEHVSEDLRAYALGELRSDRSREIETHLGSCDACRSELVAVRALTDVEPEAMNDLERTRLRRGIEAGVTAETAASTGRGGRRLYAALGAAALIAIAVVGGYFGLQGGLGMSGDDSGAGGDAGTAESAPENLTSDKNRRLERALQFDNNLGRVSEKRLQTLGERGPRAPLAALYDALGNEQQRTQQEENAKADLTRGLADAAPSSARDQIEECLAAVEGTSGALGPVPYYGALAELAGREVLVLGFAWDATPAGRERLDSYMIYAWVRGGGCDFPISYLSGRIGR